MFYYPLISMEFVIITHLFIDKTELINKMRVRRSGPQNRVLFNHIGEDTPTRRIRINRILDKEHFIQLVEIRDGFLSRDTTPRGRRWSERGKQSMGVPKDFFFLRGGVHCFEYNRLIKYTRTLSQCKNIWGYLVLSVYLTATDNQEKHVSSIILSIIYFLDKVIVQNM